MRYAYDMHPQPLVPKGRDRVLSGALSAIERAVDLVQKPPRLPLAPHRIVVLKSCCLGDTILSTPLLGALRRAYPDAHIVAGIGRWSRPALINNPDLDGLLDLEMVGVGRPRPAAYARVVRRLRAGHFDVAMVLDRTPLMTALPLLAGIPVRAGIDSAGRGFALNLRVPWREVEHEAALFLRVGAALGIPVDGVRLRFTPSDADRSAAEALWRETGLDGARVAALAPGGGRNPGMVYDAKRWPAERFAALADRLHREHGLSSVLTGAQDDRDAADAVHRRTHAPMVDVTGRTSIGVLGAILERCALFVGNDSGPTHLAAAIGIPVLAIFGPTDPHVYAPYSPRAAVLRGSHGVSTDEVSVDEALAIAEQLIQG